LLLAARIAAYKLSTQLETAVTRRFPIVALALLAGLAPASAAPQRWTFCVAWAPGAKDVWITEVFPATIDREKLEADLRNLLGRQAASRVVAQCPLPGEDKTSVINAQSGAEEFNRKLGAVLHSVSAQEFPPRR
jgi:hypothetical protein